MIGRTRPETMSGHTFRSTASAIIAFSATLLLRNVEPAIVRHFRIRVLKLISVKVPPIKDMTTSRPPRCCRRQIALEVTGANDIENQIHSLPACSLPHYVHKVFVPIVDASQRAQSFASACLFRASRGGKHLRSARAGKLDGGRADAPGTPVN
jgi:hypothetical protein